MTWRRACSICLALLVAPLTAGAQPITAENWQRHPAITEIRKIYLETRQAEVTGKLRKEQRLFEYCKAYEDGERTLYLDASGSVRSYHADGGSDDSAAQRAYYYDRGGVLRFVLVKAGAVNGTSLEYRLYLSKSGEQLWEERKLLSGPGYPFQIPLPSERLIKDPRRAFTSPNTCTEAK
jgi:hypothetical protein